MRKVLTTHLSSFSWQIRFLLCLFCVLWIALLFRLASLTLPFTQDEYLHFMPALMGRHLPDMVEKIGPNLQPSLDFLLTRFLWIPLLGHKELSLRLHALFPSLVTIIFIYITTFIYCRRQQMSQGLSLALAIVLGLWIGGQSIDGMYAFTVRHYTLVGCISVLWWHEYVISPQPVLSRRFWLASLLYLNSHFFAWPLVLGAYAGELVRLWRQRGFFSQWIDSTKIVFSLVSMLGITIPLNDSALRWLIVNPPTPNAAASLPQVLAATFKVWLDFWTFAGFDFPVLFIVILAVGVLSSFRRDSSRQGRFLLAFCLLQPLIYFTCTRKSAYPFAMRYQAIFLGEAWAIFLLCLNSFYVAVPQYAKRFIQAKKKVYSFQIVAVGVFALVAVYPNTARLVSSAYAFSWTDLKQKVTGLNFSENFREQKWVQEKRLPLLWLHDACYESDNPNYYLAFNSEVSNDPQGLGFAYPYGYLIVNWQGCEHLFHERRAAMERFFQLYPENQVVIRLKEANDSSCPSLTGALEKIFLQAPELAKGLRVERVPAEISPRCLWRVEGVRRVAELESLFLGAGIENSRPLWNASAP